MPLSVWPAIPEPDPCRAGQPPVPCPHRWQPAGAEGLISELSNPGDLVVLPGLGAGVFVFLAAAAAARRRALGLAAAPDGHQILSAFVDHGLSPQQRRLVRVEPGGPAALLTGACPDAGRAALVIATACPTPGCLPPAPGSETAEYEAPGGDERFHAACARVLAPDGLLVILTQAARHAGYPADLIARARAAGLAYTQHIIAVHARIAGSRLVTTAPPPSEPGPPAEPDPGRHLPVHTNLLVFTQGASRL